MNKKKMIYPRRWDDGNKLCLKDSMFSNPSPVEHRRKKIGKLTFNHFARFGYNFKKVEV